MAFYSSPSPPSKPNHVHHNHHHRLASVPRYSAQSFDTSYSGASYTNYSDSLLDPRSDISEYGYDSSNLAPKKSQNQLDTFGSRVFSAFSDAVKPPSSGSSPSSRGPSLHSRARSLADSAGPMLARANSIRLGGLLNRTPTQKRTEKPQQPQSEEAEVDIEEPEDLPEYKPTFTSTPDRASRRMSTQTPVRPSSSRASRFGWFQSKPDSTNPTSALELSDPLLDLNVNAALFPTGATDPLNPASFNELLTNACALISQLQTGYREKTTLLKQANAERDAAREETDEAATRAAHLKSQLETMALKAAEQDRAMRDLAAELAHARAKLNSDRHDSLLENQNADDTTPRRTRRKRTSEGVASDSGFESDADAESISFSVDTASTASVPATPGTVYSLTPGVEEGFYPGAAQQLMRGGMGAGKNGSTAGVWGVVGDLQRENVRLRGRVRELEGAVEGCLSLVGN
ncbi:hypothetical protein K461DRAFT_264797 [Myriangium duriaei CBS 260.36]|uniref:Uncharacterized protein n=1 Tax=Myriangium duriaei CBS 260.36 TaxID=1168546 RepID=A0A9P4JD92_9PEZI|nr:hypothetical protein K461DRAFT_264797 [Myriangium duriaei CBS 260.36]